jgi:hypothetical protein
MTVHMQSLHGRKRTNRIHYPNHGLCQSRGLSVVLGFLKVNILVVQEPSLAHSRLLSRAEIVKE